MSNTVITIQSGDNSNGPFGSGTGEGWADNTLPPITHGVGTVVSPIPPNLNGNLCGMCAYISAGAGTFNIFVQNTVSQSLFTRVSFTDKANTVESYDSANATFDTTSHPGYSWWHWPALLGFPFTNGHQYAMNFAVAPPVVNMNLTAFGAQSQEVDLAWTDNTNTAAAYNISRGNTVIAHIPNTVFSFADFGVAPSTTYNYSITGVNASNVSIYNPATASATTPAAGGGGGGGGGGSANVNVNYLSAFNGQILAATANGELMPAIGANVHTYFAGSLVPVTTYTDITGTVANPNPITVGVNGFLPTQVWVQAGSNTRVQLVGSDGTLLDDQDNVPGVPYIPNLTQVFVIDSVFSKDTANAASANAVNWAYNVANSAFGYANTLNVAIGNIITAVTELGGNTINIKSGNVLVNIGNTINFQNTAYANVAVDSNGNISIFANAAISGPSTNSSTVINGFIFQWAVYNYGGGGKPGDSGPFTEDFPVAFPNGLLHVQLTAGGTAGAAIPILGTTTAAAINFYTNHAETGLTELNVFAIGY